MKKIGMIVAVEIQSVLDKYGAHLTVEKEVAGYKVLEYQTEQYQLIIVIYSLILRLLHDIIYCETNQHYI